MEIQEFRWQNRPRDPEIESEMLSRLYIFLGGEEAKSRGYNVVKSTGLRNKATLNIDENGIHTLFISDIYERVWPQTIRTLETIGVQLLAQKKLMGLFYYLQKKLALRMMTAIQFFDFLERINKHRTI